MNYWQLETEEWELTPDDHDGAGWMTIRGRMEALERTFSLECTLCDDRD